MIPNVRLEPTVLGATALVMVLLWWGYRRWHGLGYGVIAASVGGIVLGGFALYLSMRDLLRGSVKCFGKNCDVVYWRSADPADFWLSIVLGAASGALLAGMGAYVLHRTVQTLYRGRQDSNARHEYSRMEGVPSALGTVCVLGVLAWILAMSEPAPVAREPLKLHLDSGAAR